jgi:hypothetical protein
MADNGIVQADFFISRAGEDKDVAVVVDKILRDAGHKTFIQDNDFGHASFMARMAQGWSSGARLICLLSKPTNSRSIARRSTRSHSVTIRATCRSA